LPYNESIAELNLAYVKFKGPNIYIALLTGKPEQQ